MTKERMGEVALALLRHKLQRDGIHLGPSLKRELGDTAKATQIPFDEIWELTSILVEEFQKDLFAKVKK